jgi:hypothetical protein
VRALTRVATPETEARLLAVGRAGTAAHVERIVRGWRRVDRLAEACEATRQHAGRAFHIHHDEDGSVVFRGRLTPEVGALLLRALDAARETPYEKRRATETLPAGDPTPETPTRAQQKADALALLAETALHHELAIPGPRGSDTRWWSTWMPRSWRIRRNPANPCWKRGATLPRKRPGGWRATRAAW